MARAGSDDVKRTLTALKRDLEADVARVRGLVAVESREMELDELLDDLGRQLLRVRGAAVITLVGATGAGKSTLLNALVGRRIAREGESRPTTSAPVVYRPRDADVSALLRELPGEPPEVVDYDPEAGGPWREQILIDAPDVNSVAAEHREIVAALADRSDVLVVVAHRQSVAELASVEFVDAFARRRGLFVVLNRRDELTADAEAELKAQLARLAAERWSAPDAPVVAISARAAQSEPSSPGWSELCEGLRGLVDGGVLGRVRRHNALGTVARLGALFGRARGEAESDLDALESALTQGFDAWRGRVDAEVRARLDLRRPQLRTLLANETARGWDGPGGWALRAGGLAALGMGAGAALLRRNPVLAAGAAAGAWAADRARVALTERQLVAADGLLPASGELAGWYRGDLGEARLLAVQLATSPTAVGVPDVAELETEATRCVGEAWETLVQRDLPASAQRAAPWPLRFLVDLPVYGFAGWIVWRAAQGFFDGSYVGLDFLLNATLLLLAWLFVWRLVLRMGVTARARGLLRETRTHASEALAAALAERCEVARRAVDQCRGGLQRLAGAEDRWRARIEGADPPDGT